MGLANYQYDEIVHIFDARRMRAKYLLDKRTEEIYNNCPEILDIDNSIATDSARRARLAIMGNHEALKGLEEDNLAREARKRDILVKNGYAPDYLTPHFECEICKDTGFMPGTNQRCKCFSNALSRLIYSESNVREIIKQENFDNFDFSLYSDTPELFRKAGNIMKSPRENIEEVVKKAHYFIDKFDSEYNNLLIYGNTGLGKTFLINCIAKELLDAAYTVVYHTAFRFFNYVEKCKFGFDASNEEVTFSEDYLIDCDLLIIDDLGTEMSNSFTNSALYTIINERHLKQHPTIISTNLSLEQFEARYSERIFSRLAQNYTFLRIIGSDIRRK